MKRWPVKFSPNFPTFSPICAAVVSTAAALGASGCNRTQPSELTPFDAGPPHMTLAQAMGLSSEKPPPPAPPTDADFVKLGSHDVDWALDPADPAADYVERYIQSTRRYGAERACVHAQPSRVEGARTVVETRDSSEHGCSGTGAVRDTFAVDVDHDRLELADPTRGDRLADWPDGSSPEGMATPSPKEGPRIDQWGSPLVKALKGLELVPLRIQFYGRGSYPLISLAGWHGAMNPAGDLAALESYTKTICEASAGFPIGIITTMDRSTVLRVRCPSGTHWEHL
jgi:hypothetical protein